ncbi:hypothetical protein BGZ67_010488 [Mortierella alpina]|nr:hypothetical protein BGZ67_010488 [Mortierella alpina]
MPNYTILIQAIPKETIVIEDGILGLFGSTKGEAQYSVSTITDIRSTENLMNITTVELISPTRSVYEKQILITSIPSAISEWGGAFSIAWGLFYFLFGAGRLDPFGIFTALFIRRKAQKYLIEGRNKDNGDNGDEGDRENQKHNGYGDMASDPTLYVPQTTSMQDGFPEPMNGIVQRQGEHIRKIEEDFYHLRRLLRDYYLDMDLVGL